MHKPKIKAGAASMELSLLQLLPTANWTTCRFGYIVKLRENTWPHSFCCKPWWWPADERRKLFIKKYFKLITALQENIKKYFFNLRSNIIGPFLFVVLVDAKIKRTQQKHGYRTVLVIARFSLQYEQNFPSFHKEAERWGRLSRELTLSKKRASD